MKSLSSEIIRLLDKLYNLRGSDSAILASMDKEKSLAEETRDETSKEKDLLESKISELSEEENVLSTEGDKLLNALSSINKDDFAKVIEHLGIEFDPEKICKDIEKSLPATMEKVAGEIDAAKKELVSVENKMTDAITKIEELGIRKDEALENQARLNHYFDLALSNNINITRDEITSLLAKFEFNEEEQREAAKLLMFPEDGLFDYENKNIEVSSSKSIGDVIHEAIKDVSPVVEEKVEVKEENIDTNEESPKELTKEVLISKLSDLGYDYLDFTSNDFAKMLENYDEKTFENNTKYIESINMDKDVFNDNIELLYDKDLENKIKKLLEIGKQVQDIYLNPSVLVKYNYMELEDAIKVLYESGLDPKTVPLMAY